MNQMDMLKVLEQFSQNVEVADGQMKVTRVADFRTVYIETIDDIGRSILFHEYKVGGTTYWAGYSSRSDTVFVSQAGQG